MPNFSSSYFRYGVPMRHSTASILNASSSASKMEYLPPMELDLSNDDSLFPIGISSPITVKGMDLTKDKISVRSYCSLQQIGNTFSPYDGGTGTRRLSTLFSSNQIDVIHALTLSETCKIYCGRGILLDNNFQPLVIIYRPVRNLKKLLNYSNLLTDGNLILAFTNSEIMSLENSLYIYVKDDFNLQSTNMIPISLKNWINKLLLWGKSTEGISVVSTKEFPAISKTFYTFDLLQDYQKARGANRNMPSTYPKMVSTVAKQTFNTYDIPDIPKLRELYFGTLFESIGSSVSEDTGLQAKIFRALNSSEAELPF